MSKKILGEKLVKMLEFCQNWIFGQKFEFSNGVTRVHCDLSAVYVKEEFYHSNKIQFLAKSG